jgi:dihydrofolate reductase
MVTNKSGLRKLKLHVQMSIDGCIAGPNGEMDWMVGLSDDQVIKYENEFMESFDTILLGRKMTDLFISISIGGTFAIIYIIKYFTDYFERRKNR